MKVTATFDQPETCNECPCFYAGMDSEMSVWHDCQLAGREVEPSDYSSYTFDVPTWCPLVAVSE